MTIVHAAWLDDGDWRQVPGVNIFVELRCVCDIGLTSSLSSHELGLVLKRVANVAILIEAVRLRRIGNIKIPVFAEVLERDVVSDEVVTDALLARGRDREGRILRSKRAVAVIAGIVIINEIVVPLDAIRVYWPLERLKIVRHSRNTRLADIAAIDITAAAVAILIVKVICGRLWVGIFNLIDGRYSRDTVGVRIKDGVAKTEHDVVGAGATHDGLVKVVIDGVFVGKLFEIRSVAFRHIVEGHGS